MLILHANIVTMDEQYIEDGYIYITGGKISAVGHAQEAPSDPRTLDFSGRTVYPGFIDPHCHLGMWEDGLGFEGDDGNESTDPVTPHLRALDAVNPLDRCFRDAAAAGVTTVVTGPGSANPIGGEWVALKTFGFRVDDMVIKVPVGIKFALGENPKTIYEGKNQMPVTRMAIAALIREQLEKAVRYTRDVERARESELSGDNDFDMPDYDPKCESLRPLLGRKMKAFFHAHRADDMFTALRIAREYGLDAVIIHGTEGHLIADTLAAEGVRVITGPLICDRSKPETKQHDASTPARLIAAGVCTAICTDHPVTPIGFLPLTCGVAIREGLPREAALRAITADAATICGIDDRVGSITAGKDADFAVFDDGDDPFSVYTRPRVVIINGEIVYERA